MYWPSTTWTFLSPSPRFQECLVTLVKRTTQRGSHPFLYTPYLLLNLFFIRANTTLAGMTRKYKNAFCIVCPAITDSSLVSTTDRSYHSRLRHLSAWGMPAQGSSLFIDKSTDFSLTNYIKTYANALAMVS